MKSLQDLALVDLHDLISYHFPLSPLYSGYSVLPPNPDCCSLWTFAFEATFASNVLLPGLSIAWSLFSWVLAQCCCLILNSSPSLLPPLYLDFFFFGDVTPPAITLMFKCIFVNDLSPPLQCKLHEGNDFVYLAHSWISKAWNSACGIVGFVLC